MGWKATQFMGSLCDSSVWRGGGFGSQAAGSFRFEREVGVALSSSVCRASFRLSRSMICGVWLDVGVRQWERGNESECQGDERLKQSNTRDGADERAFFCNRTMPVHFFSSRVSYFFAVAVSNVFSLMLVSSRREAAAFGRLLAERYAMMDL
jgi:hypothetical protein